MIIQTANRLNTVFEYYFSKKLDEIRQLEASGHSVINLGIGSPDMAPSQETLEVLCKSAQSDDNHGYQSYRGINDLRKAISTYYLKTYNVELDYTSEILPLMGSKEGIMHISMAFLNPGDQVLIPNPGYPTYSSVTNLVGAIPVFYDLQESNNWHIDIEQLKQIELDDVKLMWINTPHMPTGVQYDKAELEALIELAKKHQFLICCDNPYSRVLINEPHSILELDGAREVVLELNSLSKSHNMAGWRIGWLAGAKDYIDTVLRVKSNMDSGMFLPLQLAAIEALNNSDEWHRNRNEVYAARKQKVFELFDLLGCAYNKDQVGLFVWAKAPDHVEDVEEWIDELIRKAGVFITPGFIFGSNANRFVRVSLCSSEELIEQATEQIKEMVCV